MTSPNSHPAPNFGVHPSPPYGSGTGVNAHGAPTAAFIKPIGWFVITWYFLWPLAIYSLVSAWRKIDPALSRGDVPGAQHQADRVKWFGITALCFGVVLAVVFAVVMAKLEVRWLKTSAGCTNGHSC